MNSKYTIPKSLVTLFPYKCSPLHGVQPMADRAHKFAYESSLFTATQYRRIECSSHFTAYFYPFCENESRYEVLLKGMHNFFTIDDHFETPYGDMHSEDDTVDTVIGQFYSVLDKLKSNQLVPIHNWKPYILATYNIYKEILAEFNDIQKLRFFIYWKSYIDYMVTECKALNNEEYKTLEDFYKMRDDSGFYFVYQLIEYACDLYVPESEWLNSDFQRLLQMLCRLSVICNDICSLEKELMDTEGRLDRIHNGVAILARIEGISIDESITVLTQLYVNMEKSAMVLANDIIMSKWSSTDTRAFVKNLKYMTGGHWKLCTSLDRYTKLTE